MTRIGKILTVAAALIALAACGWLDAAFNGGALAAWVVEQTPPAVWGAIVGALLFAPAFRFWNKWRNRPYQGWRFEVIKRDGSSMSRSIGLEKAKEILNDESTMSVYAKGIASSYGFLNEDLVTEGRVRRTIEWQDEPLEGALFTVDEDARIVRVDYRFNPVPKTSPPKNVTLQQLQDELLKLKQAITQLIKPDETGDQPQA